MNSSFWENTHTQGSRDVMIVGGGFSGLWIAAFLKEKYHHFRITVLEANAFGATASTKNAGFACFGSPSEILSDFEQIGFDKTVELLRWRFNGIDRIAKSFTAKNIHYHRHGGWELFHKEQTALWEKVVANTSLLDEIAKAATGKNLFELQKPLPSYANKFLHGAYSKYEAQLNPFLLQQQLLKKCRRLGIEVLQGVVVDSFNEKSDSVSLETSVGSFTAKNIVFTTNSHTDSFYPGENVNPARAQVLITEPIENLSWRGIFHMDEGYYYFRNVGNRLLLGGARHRNVAGETTHELGTSDIIQNDLEQQLKNHILPGQDYRIEKRWSGIMAMGKEKTPIQKQITDRIYLSTRLSGMGVALAPELGVRFVAQVFNP